MVIFKKIGIYAAVYAGLILLFVLLSTTAASLPANKKFNKNAQESVSRISGKNASRFLLYNGVKNYPLVWGAYLDDFTDALILNCALGYHKTGENAFNSAMQNYICYTDSKQWREKNIDAMKNYPEIRQDNVRPYSRYWFGSSAIVKIAHYLFSLRHLYSLLGTAVLLLIFGVFSEVLKSCGRTCAVAFVLLMGGLNFYVCFQSLQYSPVFIIALAGVWSGLYMQRKNFKYFDRNLHLFCLGMLCAYFDLLTAPLLTVFLPLFFMQDKTSKQDLPSTGGNPPDVKKRRWKLALSAIAVIVIGGIAFCSSAGDLRKGKTLDLIFDLDSNGKPCDLFVSYKTGSKVKSVTAGKVASGKVKVVLPAKRIESFALNLQSVSDENIRISNLCVSGRRVYANYELGKATADKTTEVKIAGNAVTVKLKKSEKTVISWKPDFTLRCKKTSYGKVIFVPLLAMALEGLAAGFICCSNKKSLLKQAVRWFNSWMLPAAFWLLGYAASWGTKLLIADCLSGKFLSSWQSIVLRSSSADPTGIEFSRFDAVKTNFGEFFEINRMIFIFTVIIAVALLVRKLYGIYRKKLYFDFRTFVGYCCYALVPIAFVICLANHSQIHAFMVYRNISLVIIALFLALTASFNKIEE